jgi:lysophospholipase L1-like esterase
LYAPTEIISIKDYRLRETYVEGIDFLIEGNKIKRTLNSKMPFLKPEEYWVDEEAKNANTVDNINFQLVPEGSKGPLEFGLTGQRYLKVRENILPEFSQCVISYRHNDPFPTNGFYPQSKGIESFINKLKTDKKASIVFYGDSITEGWTASGHKWEWSIEPEMSSWVHMVEDYLEAKYDAEIDVTNEAIGGWTTSQGLANYDIKMDGSVPHRHSHESTDRTHEKLNPDLLVLGFGMNDWTLDPTAYRTLIAKIVAKYYAANPNGNVILISSMPANVDTEIEGNQKYFEKELELVAHNYEGTLVAPVYSTYQQLFAMGKNSRDILSNNVNHPNDFGVRVYAQVVLKTLLGSEYCDESIKVSE